MRRITIIGSSGQLAQAFRVLLPEAIFLGREQLDLGHPAQVKEVLARTQPSLVINTAAYTQVDKAESEEALAHTVNAESPAAMAEYCATQQIPFVHYSTDYVFDGSGTRPWREGDIPSPLNAYGRSKLAGEKAILAMGGKHIIFRTSWVYDAFGRNFVNTILRLVGERESLSIIDDQFGAPTYAPHLAQATLQALAAIKKIPDFPSGIYHLCNAGEATWYRFAVQIVQHAQRIGLPVKTSHIHPIKATQYPLPAPRPYNSRLDCAKALSILGVAMPSWEEGLTACMELRTCS